MIEQVLHPHNLMRAYKQVLENKGSCGVDGLNVKDLYAHLHAHRKEIEASLREGRYFPQSILGCEFLRAMAKLVCWVFLRLLTDGYNKQQ